MPRNKNYAQISSKRGEGLAKQIAKI